MGRPGEFTQEVADLICAGLMEGYSLRKICASDEMPACSTVYKWLIENQSFSEQYTRAREVQADVMADEIIDISDDGSNDTYEDDDGHKKTDYDVIARSRLRVDSRKWIASKLKPKKYGDKVTAEHTGEGGGPIVFKVERVGKKA